MRRSGMLLPVASLPSKYGIGSFSNEAYDFIDILKDAGQSLWQILPIGPTGYGDSPYQSFSTFAGNPYFIDLDELVKEGLLSEEECNSYDWGSTKEYIDYEKIYLSRFKVLKKAYKRSNINESSEFKVYCEKNKWWIDDYSLYMSIKDYFCGKSWTEWENDIKSRQEKAIYRYEKELKDDIIFYKYLQYLFYKQWNRLKSYANKNGISIVGDIPIYVSLDSSDTWSNPELFQLDKEFNPIALAGCPPDRFSKTGQLWGNPLYCWGYHSDTSYEWWIKRIEYSFKLYDIVRIDHFRGFDAYYSIPYDSLTAESGKWEKGPGLELFKHVKEKLGELDIIAEDLGFLTESTKQLLESTGYPGMKILQFAFDATEDSDYLPHNYNKNCVVYTGTHDNSTIFGWYKCLNKADKRKSINYMNNKYTKYNEIHWDFICLAMMSIAEMCIIPVQDYLGLGDETRINIPSTLGNNWTWRMLPNYFSKNIINKINTLTRLYGRL
ncbi:MAG: 4-alpha-glucanotransferase [Romboutsia sp.]